MSWKVSELDKNKTEASISNELARLDTCKETLQKLEREYDFMCESHKRQEMELFNKMEKIKNSIISGENFVMECREHLKSFE